MLLYSRYRRRSLAALKIRQYSSLYLTSADDIASSATIKSYLPSSSLLHILFLSPTIVDFANQNQFVFIENMPSVLDILFGKFFQCKIPPHLFCMVYDALYFFLNSLL